MKKTTQHQQKEIKRRKKKQAAIFTYCMILTSLKNKKLERNVPSPYNQSISNSKLL